jgi:hypothetical protein
MLPPVPLCETAAADAVAADAEERGELLREIEEERELWGL